VGGVLGLTAAEDAAARNCRKIKNKKRRKRCLANAATPPCAAESQCGEGCCEPNSCFASAVDDETTLPLGYACCPAEKLCSRSPFADQCCYPDETCQPSLADDINAETICCRPCAGGVGGCCLKLNEECIGGVCTPVDTARLARTRRPS